MSYQTAKRGKIIRDRSAKMIDGAFSAGANRVKICGNGKRHNWSVLISDLFFTDCACCIFYRGMATGVIITAMIAIII